MITDTLLMEIEKSNGCEVDSLAKKTMSHGVNGYGMTGGRLEACLAEKVCHRERRLPCPDCSVAQWSPMQNEDS